jgi:hypothetical protein
MHIRVVVQSKVTDRNVIGTASTARQGAQLVQRAGAGTPAFVDFRDVALSSGDLGFSVNGGRPFALSEALGV